MSLAQKVKTAIAEPFTTKRTNLQVLEFVAFVGSVYWIYVTPKEPEPYVTAISLLAALRYTLHGDEKTPPPDVIAYIKVCPHNHRLVLVLENRSPNSAMDVSFNLKLKPNQEDPRVIGDGPEPIPEIYGNDEQQFLVGFTYATGATFDAEWSWRDSKGRMYSRRSQIGIKDRKAQ